MLAYTIYRGIQGGWLDPSSEAYAARMRQAAHSRLDERSFIRGVCGVPEGQSFFLLMETAAQNAGALDV
jgi:hypothetical protein